MAYFFNQEINFETRKMADETPITAGTLTIYTGCMASSKTTELYRMQQMLLNNKHHKAFSIGNAKNKINVDRGYVMSRAGCKYEAEFFEVLSPALAERIINEHYTDVLIDEGQFFDTTGKTELFDFCVILLRNGVSIYIAALNGDYEAKPWEAMSYIFPLATQINVFSARCDDCGAPASFTHRVSDNKNKIGIHDTYNSLCGTHWLAKNQ